MMSLHDTLLGGDSPVHMEESDGASSPPSLPSSHPRLAAEKARTRIAANAVGGLNTAWLDPADLDQFQPASQLSAAPKRAASRQRLPVGP